MTGQPSHMRKPYEAPPYASLRKTEAVASDVKAGVGDGSLATNVANDFQVEVEKLKQLREALWAAFEAGPEGGLPNTLIDLTIAYTNALRLQLNLRSVSSRQAKPNPQPSPSYNRDAAAKS
jgi:hypothetical protein